MTRIPGYPGAALHWPDGSHRSTPATAHGHTLDVHARALSWHLSRHGALTPDPTHPRTGNRLCLTPEGDDR